MTSPGSLIHTLEMFRLSADTEDQYVYIGEGNAVYRIQLSTLLSSGSATSLGNVGTTTQWGKRWTAVKFDPGYSGKAYFFIAAVGGMKKNPAIATNTLESDGGSADDTLYNWGIVPPPSPVAATASTASTAAITLDASAFSWTDAEDNAVKVVNIVTSAKDLSVIGSISSGVAADGYENDDFITITMTPSNPNLIQWYALDIDVTSNFSAYYTKYIVPYSGGGALAQTEDPTNSYLTQFGLYQAGLVDTLLPPYDPEKLSANVDIATFDDTLRRARPIELPPSAAGAAVTIKIKKSDFLPVGSAGEAGPTGKNWKNVTKMRLSVRSAEVPSAGLTLTINSMAIDGGGGLQNISGAKQPYRWLYTYRNDKTGNESNPCPEMITSGWLEDIDRQKVDLSGLVASGDAQATSKSIYRAGGSYVDSFYRLVGHTTATTFTDYLSDDDIKNSKILEFDNDPPVPSKMATAMAATMGAVAATGSQTVALTISQPSGITAEALLTVGTRLQVLDTDKSEEVQVTALSGNNVTAYFQSTHASGVSVTASTVVNRACRLSCVVGNSVFLAGDDTNPHMLYKSKGGKPESFPVIVDIVGTVNQQPVGSPSNPIMAITSDYSGGDSVISLNLLNIYLVRVLNGQMQPPTETPAQRGLLSNFGWCKADNGIYYLSHDGIYLWQGGTSKKVSEAIDWFFNNKTVSGIAPMNKADSALQYVYMAYHHNTIHLVCRDTNGGTVWWRYETLYDRWTRNDPATEGTSTSITVLLPWDGELYTARSVVSGATSAYIYREDQGTADNATAIPFLVHPGAYQLDDPILKKQWGDILLDVENNTGSNTLTAKVYYDFSGTPSETLSVLPTASRQLVPLPLNSGAAQAARAIAVKFEGNTTTLGGYALYSMTFNYLPLAEVQRGRAYDYSDWGYPHDKRLDQLVIEYNTGGTTITMDMDIIHGINGNSEAQQIQQFTLSSAGRARATLPIKVTDSTPPTGYTAGENVVCKMVRLKPSSVASADFQLYEDSTYFKYAEYPPDITNFTDPSDYGNPYQKYWQQLVIDIDTGNVACTVEVFIDDGTGAGTPTKYQSLSLTTTQSTRQQTITLNPGLVGKKARLKLTPGASGKAQIFSHDFVTAPADKGPVFHTSDYDNLEYPYDKRLKSVTFEYEVTTQATMSMYAITGYGSTQTITQISDPTIVLYAGGRRITTQQLGTSSGTAPIAKAVRFQPTATNTVFKTWKYWFDYEKMPPDVVSETNWDDGGYPYEKYLQQLSLEMDTGSVACQVDLYTDAGQRETFSVTTSDTDRVRLITVPSVETTQASYGGSEAGVPMECKKWRLKFTPSAGGKSQYYNHTMKWVQSNPGPVVHSMQWDDLGHPYDKRLKNVAISYDGKGAANAVVKIDTLSGLAGATQTTPAKLVTLSSSSRGMQQFDLSGDNLVVKAVRVHPSTIPLHDFRVWTHKFDFDPYPADIVEATDWSDLDYPDQKNLQHLDLTVDTGGVAATVEVQKDGGTTVKSFTVNTSSTSRRHYESLHVAPADYGLNTGYLFRLVAAPGVGGKFQLFNVDFDRTLEPAQQTRVDTGEQFIGSAGWSYIRSMWIEYQCGSTITVKFYRDSGELFYTKQGLPTHTYRDVEHFYLPTSVSGKTNKSRAHRIVIETDDGDYPFKLYSDTSRIEVREISGDQRAGYRQIVIFDLLGPKR
jgi:hypothetical protein